MSPEGDSRKPYRQAVTRTKKSERTWSTDSHASRPTAGAEDKEKEPTSRTADKSEDRSVQTKTAEQTLRNVAKQIVRKPTKTDRACGAHCC